MKKSILFLLLIAMLGSTFYGVRSHFNQVSELPKVGGEEIQKRLSTFHPLLKDQKFVAVVLAENVEEEVARNLRSLFDQSYGMMRIIYIDNGSSDATYVKCQKLIESAGKSDRITLLKVGEHKPMVEILYDVISTLEPHEVVALIDGKDWLSHENVFDHLNCAYANPDVWMTYSRSISHPDYQSVAGKPFDDQLLNEKKLRKDVRTNLSPLVTFYAGFFQQIRLQDLLHEGSFIDECGKLALHLPLVEMGPEHLLFMDEISYVKNESDESTDHKLHLQKVAAVESHLRSLSPYPTLSALNLIANSPLSHRYTSDLIFFSDDSPMHLYACLESVFLKTRDIGEVYVLFKGSDQEFQRAYLNLQSEFHNVHFLNVCDYPGNDFSSLITKVLSNRRHASPYVVIGDDHTIFEERIRFHDCIAAMEKVHADHFFLGAEEREEPLPDAIAIAPGIFAWQLGEKGSLQEFSLSLCRKSLFDTLTAVNDFSSFKHYWRRHLQPEVVALFFDEKMVLSMNSDKEPSLATKREWSHKFIEGFKIDLPSLSSEIDELENGELPLIRQEKHRPMLEAL
ncbi:MAG: hypothetical protein K1060chlam2_00741 [Chlamydiae bacterium]|nr:hypothetical protein [Chlamydiota bacterium]